MTIQHRGSRRRCIGHREAGSGSKRRCRPWARTDNFPMQSASRLHADRFGREPGVEIASDLILGRGAAEDLWRAPLEGS
jgi:hypothetical protein